MLVLKSGSLRLWAICLQVCVSHKP
ncbi:hypothetical protein AHF37_12368 [Paragonimus kellicotti]|nr:hypothetical protein AHF37_12368 [Paragonimus kellicotti]